MKKIYPRKIFEYMDIEQKKKAIELLKKDLAELDLELRNNSNQFSQFIKSILIDTKDKWAVEIRILEDDVKDANQSE